MTVVLTGRDLTVEQLLRVARDGEEVEVSADAVELMRTARDVVDEAVASGASVYGVTTGVGMRRDARVERGEIAEFNRIAISGHRVGLGDPASVEVVRAALARLANGLVAGFQGVRPELAQLVVDALNGRNEPTVPSLGTLGQADLAQNADLAFGVLGDFELAAGEAGALLVTNAFSTAQAALAVADSHALLDVFDAAGALDFEAFRANIGALDEAVADSRPYQGVRQTVATLRRLLDGSALWEPEAPRFLQDPLTFRCLPQIHGAARDAMRFVDEQLATELNAHQGNPLVVPAAGKIVSVGNFDSLPLAMALDFVRIALAPVVTSAVERTLKLLSPRFSGLTEGLVAREGSWEDGLSELGVAAQAIAAEARLLAQPVSFELASTMQESGVEDRTALTSLGARRLDEMCGLAARVIAIELAVAAQAVDLRGEPRLGAGARATYDVVRSRIPFLGPGDTLPLPLEELSATVRSGLELGT
ncbi:MAG: aromatic amino acid lyase [Gaiellaceae bacterium]